jgi:hypothetical protein
VRNLRFRDTTFDFEIEREPDVVEASLTVTEAGRSLPLAVELTLPIGAEPVDASMRASLQSADRPESPMPGSRSRERGTRLTWFPRTEDGADSIRVEHTPGIEIRPLHEPLRLGDTSSRLRIIDVWLDGSSYTARLEGRAGRAYRVEMNMPFELESLTGAREVSRQDGKILLEIVFPTTADDWGTIDVVAELGGRPAAVIR